MKHLILFFLLLSTRAWSQDIPAFSLVNATDNSTVSLADFSKAPGVVIIFTSNACAYDTYYLSRMLALQQAYASRVPVLLINAHLDDEESATAMKAFAEKNKLTMPYLADKDQTVMTLLNARKSPEAFLLKNTNGKFSLWYRGAIDDNPQSASDVKTAFLKNAIDQLLAGQKPAAAEERPVGCSIRKK